MGRVQYPSDFEARPRRYSLRWRLVAGAVLLVFALVGVATTVLSLGEYCLTTDADNTAALPRR